MHALYVLVGRWSRRDWLAVLVIALTASLLVGASLLVVSAGVQTTALAGDHDANATVTAADSIGDATDVAGPDDVVLPTATAIGPDGDRRTIVGVPADSPGSIDLPAQPEGTVGMATTAESWRLEGADESSTLSVEPARTASEPLPPEWIRTTPETVEAVGPTGALVLSSTADAGGTPLMSAFSFFANGTDEVLAIVWTGVGAAGVIVAVTLSSVVRMTIRDRARTIRVLRATGAPPRRISAALTARAGLLAAAGGALGYAIGVIVPNAAVNVAVGVGLPTTISVQFTPASALLVASMLGSLVAFGAVTGYVVARDATARPPARVGTTTRSGPARWHAVCDRLVPVGLGRRLAPAVLSTRTIVPTMATLSTFAVVVLLVASLGTVGASLSTGEATVTEPGVSHPINSNVPTSYGDALEADGVAASPEIVLLSSSADRSYLARGAEYDRFAAVTGARLIEGEEPEATHEAVIGVALADVLDVDPGDELTIGGSTETALTQVTVVGTYETGGLDDHQLLVSLPTARHLSSVEEGAVNLIRTETADETPLGESAPESATVVAADAPAYVKPGETVPVSVTLWNPTGDPVEQSVTATLGDDETTRPISVDPTERRSVTVELSAPEAGEYTLVVGGIERPVTVSESPPIELAALPDAAPPDESMRVLVREPTGDPVADATVSIATETATTDAEGVAWVQTPAATGTHELHVDAADRELTEPIEIDDAVEPAPVATASLSSDALTIHSRPTVEADLTNPWARPIETSVTIDGHRTTDHTDVSIDPGETTTVSTTLPQHPPGTYTVAVLADGQSLTTTEYDVGGDDRLTSSLAASGHYDSGGSFGNAIEYAVGNLQVVLGALIGLAAVTVVGATSIVLARAVREKRRTIAIYRATGAPPRRILTIVVGDTIRFATVASVAALLIGLLALELLSIGGRLTAFGITLDPQPSLPLAIGIVGGGILLAVVSAIVATLPLLWTPPSALLSAAERE